MPDKRPIIYWDSCTFISWLTGEPRAPNEDAGLYAAVDEINLGKVILVVSTQIWTEILRDKIGDEGYRKFRLFLNRGNVQVISINDRISMRAGQIRDFHRQDNGKTITTPDAIHLATALIYRAGVFHTFDKKLLRLRNNVMDRFLRIEEPNAVVSLQGVLRF